jgi:hypothetical protein
MQESNPSHLTQQRTMQAATEKRQQPRHIGVFPVRLHFTSPSGDRLKIHTLADNASQDGLYLQLPYHLDIGSTLFVVLTLPSGAKLAAFGQILRTESKNQALFGLAIGFHQTRLLSAAAA